MFGTSGIRGVYGKDITELLAVKISNAFADKDVAIGRDVRKSGVPLSSAAAAGAMAAGRDVISLGIVPTPTVALATRKHFSNGIMVTASHNPEQYNGLKLISETKEIGKDYEKLVVGRYSEPMRVSSWDNTGNARTDNDIISDHISMVEGLVNTKLISEKRPKILIDCNGAGTVITPKLMKSLGCKVGAMNASLDGFTRPSEPNEKNLPGLISKMREQNADLGMAHDGDADRVVIVDDTGNILPLDVQLAMMIEHEMKASDNKKIISTMEASLAIRDVVERNGGSIRITPVGSTYVSDVLEQDGALFGGEPCGEYIYEKGVHVPDAMLAAAKFVELFCMEGKLSGLRNRYGQHPMAREKFEAKDKYATVDNVKSSISIEGKRTEEDGVRVDEEDGWFLIRASGTEPIVRLTMEYKSGGKLEKRKSELTQLIKENLA